MSGIFFFFSTIHEKKVLIGKKSEGDKDSSIISDLIIPMETEKSLLVSCLVQGKAIDSFSCRESSDLAITDEQMIRFLGTDGILCLPLTAQR